MRVQKMKNYAVMTSSGHRRQGGRSSHHSVGLAGINLGEVPVLFRRRKVVEGVEGIFRLKIIDADSWGAGSVAVGGWGRRGRVGGSARGRGGLPSRGGVGGGGATVSAAGGRGRGLSAARPRRRLDRGRGRARRSCGPGLSVGRLSAGRGRPGCLVCGARSGGRRPAVGGAGRRRSGASRGGVACRRGGGPLVQGVLSLR